MQEQTLSAVVTLPLSKIGELIQSTGSQIAYCKFLKRDNSVRTMSFKGISAKYIKGGEKPYNAKAKKLSPVWCIKSQGIRSIRWESVLELNVKGQRYNFMEG